VVNSKRFEKGVYADLVSLRDRGYCFVGGKKRKTYSGVRRSQIKDASNAALRNLSTSWTLCQIMGWHCLNNLDCTLAELRKPENQLKFAAKLLMIVAGDYIRRKDYDAVFRIWNTGRANGKTYHASYVPNALAVKAAYNALLRDPSRHPVPEWDELTPQGVGVGSDVVIDSFDDKTTIEDSDDSPNSGGLDAHPDDIGTDATGGISFDEIRDDIFDSIMGRVKDEVGGLVESAADRLARTTGDGKPDEPRTPVNFPAFIPRLSWRKILGIFTAPSLMGLGSIGSYIAGAPWYVVFILGILCGLGIKKGYDYIQTHHAGVLSYISQMQSTLANPDLDNPILTNDVAKRASDVLMDLFRRNHRNVSSSIDYENQRID